MCPGKDFAVLDDTNILWGFGIAERNINNLRYADDTTLMAESEEELKSLLMSQINFTLPSKVGKMFDDTFL